MTDGASLLGMATGRIRHMIARALIALIDDSGGTQRAQLTRYAGQLVDPVAERFAEYGFVSKPFAGAEGIAVYLGGSREAAIIVATNDRRYRLTGLADGEVAIHDDQGQKVHLTRAGIVVDGGGNTVTITNAPHIRCETALLEVTGDILDNCDAQPRTMASMRQVYDIHTHDDVQPGAGNTGGPAPTM